MTDVQDAPGDVTFTDAKMQVVFHRLYRQPIEKVWAALTVPERLADWLAVAELEPRIGGRIVLNWTGAGHSMEGKVLAYDAPRTFAFTWPMNGVDTVVRFHLTPEGDGCRLTLTHSNLGVKAGGGGGVRAGWHAHLAGLSDAIEGRATPWPTIIARMEKAQPLYPALPA